MDQIWTRQGPNMDQTWTKHRTNIEQIENKYDKYGQNRPNMEKNIDQMNQNY